MTNPNKIIVNGNTLIDVTGDTVTAATLLSGYTAHDASGTAILGTASGGTPTLQTKSETYTPSETAQTDAITADSGYDGLDTVNITVSAISSTYVGSGITQRTSSDLSASGATVTAPAGYYASSASTSVSSGTAGTPTATKGTVSGHAVSVTPSVTNTAGYISGGTKTGTAVSVSASELVSGTYTVDSSGTKDVTNYASASVAAGTAGTPSATKGAVSSHSISVTPSVTNSTGWITGSTKTGTAVTVSASELVSGSETKTANGTYDVTNLAELVVNVSGGADHLTKLATKNLGTISTSSTSAADTGQTLSVTGFDGYDMMIAVCHTSTHTNGRHVATVRLLNFSATSTSSTKTAVSMVNSTQHWKLSSSGTMQMRSGTTPYGVYVNAATLNANASPRNVTLTIYQRYNSNSTGTVNGTYVLDVYGVKLQDLF